MQNSIQKIGDINDTKSKAVRPGGNSPKRNRDGEIVLPGPKSKYRNNKTEQNTGNDKEQYYKFYLDSA